MGSVHTADLWGYYRTTTRRIILHDRIHDEFVAGLKSAYQAATVGNPLHEGTLVGPLIDQGAFDSMQHALEQAKAQGGTVFGGTRCLAADYPDAYYVEPAIVEMPEQTAIVQTETFAPILYVMRYTDFDQ